MRGGAVVEARRFLIRIDRLGPLLLLQIDRAEVRVRAGVDGFDRLMIRERLIDRRERHAIRIERLVVAAGVEEHRAEVEVGAQKCVIEIGRFAVRGDRFVLAAERHERVAEAELVLRIVGRELRRLGDRRERVVVAIERTKNRRAQRVQRGIARRFRDRCVDVLQRVGRLAELLRGRGGVESSVRSAGAAAAPRTNVSYASATFPCLK